MKVDFSGPQIIFLLIETPIFITPIGVMIPEAV